MESRGICDKLEDIDDAFKCYFSTLFTTSGPSQDNIKQCMQAIEPKVTDAMKLRLTSALTLGKKVELTLKQVSPFKSHGPNGFGSCFYQQHWSIIGNEVSKLS